MMGIFQKYQILQHLLFNEVFNLFLRLLAVTIKSNHAKLLTSVVSAEEMASLAN